MATRKKSPPEGGAAPDREVRAATPISRVPGTAEVEWRVERMSKLGAGDQLALEVASSDVDLHDIERLLAMHCPLSLAWQIMYPLEAWDVPVLAAAEAAA